MMFILSIVFDTGCQRSVVYLVIDQKETMNESMNVKAKQMNLFLNSGGKLNQQTTWTDCPNKPLACGPFSSRTLTGIFGSGIV